MESVRSLYGAPIGVTYPKLPKLEEGFPGVALTDLAFTEAIGGMRMAIGMPEFERLTLMKGDRIADDPHADKYFLEMRDTLLERLPYFDKALDRTMVFGQLVGPKIGDSSKYFSNERHFLVFDVFDEEDGVFYGWEGVKQFAQKFGLETVPEVPYDRPDLALASVRGFVENLPSALNPSVPAEGVAIRLRRGYDLYAKRRMTVVRRKDFR